MNNWYIDRSKNFHNDTLLAALNCIHSCPTKDAPTVEGKLATTGALGEAGGNPKAALTRLRDHGLMRMDNSIGEPTYDYMNGLITGGELVIDLFLKRSAAKGSITKVKPFVQLCQFFDLLIANNYAAKDIFITFSECKEYLFPLDSYSELTFDVAKRIVESRVYSDDSPIPTPNISLSSNEKTNLSIWFNALKTTKIFSPFEYDDRTVLRANIMQRAFFRFISVNAPELAILNSAENEEVYKYYCDRRTGINEILPNVVRSNVDLVDTDVRTVVEYIVGYRKNDRFDYQKYFRFDCFGIYLPFVALPGLICRKISMTNKSFGEKVKQFFDDHSNVIEGWRFSEYQYAGLYSNNTFIEPVYATGLKRNFARNRILFGAPGTGKSFTLNGDRKELLYNDRTADESDLDHSLYGTYERVTFHPDYSYANFVGTYKPVPCKDSDGKDAITYSYVPGPFMRTYVKALQNGRTEAPKPFLLVIEEINRANVAAVFGDVFQLLDRGDDEVSEYPIQASEDIKKYLAGELGGNPNDYSEIRIPDNMFIWATMNSADQGVFPMDTAFKRRWDFTYLGIDDSEAGIVGKKVVLGQGEYQRGVEWNALRKAINNELLNYKVNEDKLMGPYFIAKKNLPEGEMFDGAVFTRIFKNKVIMYLFDDAAKQKRITLFGGCDEKAKNQYSKICREFDTKGVYIFCEAISSQFIDNIPEDDGV